MTVEADLLELMPHFVTVEKRISTTEYGVPTYGTSSRYQARVERKRRMVRNAAGEEKISTVTVYFGSTPGLNPEDRITLPDGTTPVILSTESQPGAVGEGEYYEAVYT